MGHTMHLRELISALQEIELEKGNIPLLLMDESGSRAVTEFFIYYLESENLRDYFDDIYVMIMKSRTLTAEEMGLDQ